MARRLAVVGADDSAAQIEALIRRAEELLGIAVSGDEKPDESYAAKLYRRAKAALERARALGTEAAKRAAQALVEAADIAGAAQYGPAWGAIKTGARAVIVWTEVAPFVLLWLLSEEGSRRGFF